MPVKYTDTNPKLPTREQKNAVAPRKIFLKRNIDYVTRAKRGIQGSFNSGNTNDTIDLYQTIQTAINRGWINVMAGGGIYGGSGDLTENTIVTGHGLDLSFVGVDAFNINSTTLTLFNKYDMPNATPTSDGSDYVIVWNNGTPSFATKGTGGGIYSGSGSLSGGTTVTMGANTLTFSGDYAHFSMPNSGGTGLINLYSQLSAFNTATLALNPTSNASIQLRPDANNLRTVAATTASSMVLSGTEAGVNYSYSFPNVTPTSDTTPYTITWTDGTPSFTKAQRIKVSANDTTPKYFEDVVDATSAIKVTTLNDGSNETVSLREASASATAITKVDRIATPLNGTAHSTTLQAIMFTGTVASTTLVSLTVIPADAAVDGSGMPIYWNMRGMVYDTTTLEQFPLGDSTHSGVTFAVVDNTGPQLEIDNTRANEITYAIYFEYLKEV